uniref:Salivary kunitz domain protein n=1 Tax=Ixodes ricinus TaxID=34613 RepID=V5GHI0_IXORI
MKIKYLCIFIAAAFGYPECETGEIKKDVCQMDPPDEQGKARIPGWFYNKSLVLCQYYEFGAVYRRKNRKKPTRFSFFYRIADKTCRRHVPGILF